MQCERKEKFISGEDFSWNGNKIQNKIASQASDEEQFQIEILYAISTIMEMCYDEKLSKLLLAIFQAYFCGCMQAWELEML